MMVADIYKPMSYRQAADFEKERVCNGCGPGSWKIDLVPDRIYGLDISEACNVHDWMYYEGRTSGDKSRADRAFLENILIIIDNQYCKKKRWYRGILRFLRRRRAYKYYEAVSNFGDDAFNSDKPI